jgi:GNAT superfamily N-acetyltransferase
VPIACKPEPAFNDSMQVGAVVLRVRPIEITDAARLARMFERLSRESVRMRFFAPIPQLPWGRLVRFADVDHCRREALVALHGDDIVAVARYDAASSECEPADAEVAVTVEDAWQGRGVGRRLAWRLALLAGARGYDTFVARVLPENRAALGLVRKLSPDAVVRFSGGEYEARLPLPAARFSPRLHPNGRPDDPRDCRPAGAGAAR